MSFQYGNNSGKP